MLLGFYEAAVWNVQKRLCFQHITKLSETYIEIHANVKGRGPTLKTKLVFNHSTRRGGVIKEEEADGVEEEARRLHTAHLT